MLYYSKIFSEAMSSLTNVIIFLLISVQGSYKFKVKTDDVNIKIKSRPDKEDIPKECWEFKEKIEKIKENCSK